MSVERNKRRKEINSEHIHFNMNRDEKKKKTTKGKRFFDYSNSHCYFFKPGENEDEEEAKALSTDIDEALLYFEYIKLAKMAMKRANNVNATNITMAHC